jgi:hypothetical protein
MVQSQPCFLLVFLSCSKDISKPEQTTLDHGIAIGKLTAFTVQKACFGAWLFGACHTLLLFLVTCNFLADFDGELSMKNFI